MELGFLSVPAERDDPLAVLAAILRLLLSFKVRLVLEGGSITHFSIDLIQ